MQSALGLDYAHSKGLVHRDVKPGNILVMPSGDAKVSDVGLAGFAKDLVNDPRAGKIVGTTDYLSPEQIRTPLDIKPASDIYSLGCTLYYAVCGKVPFPGGDTASKLSRHLEETPWHPRKFAPDISEDFVDIIADMMDKDPTKRITNAAEVASRLEPWVSDSLGVGAVGGHAFAVDGASAALARRGTRQRFELAAPRYVLSGWLRREFGIGGILPFQTRVRPSDQPPSLVAWN